MAIASIELSGVTSLRHTAVPVYGACVRQESLTISGTTATLATAVTAIIEQFYGSGVVGTVDVSKVSVTLG